MYTTLRGLGKLVAYLPYELGFQPSDSLVVVGFADGRLHVVARLDLACEKEIAPGLDRIGETFEQAGVRDALCCAVVDTRAALERVGSPMELLERSRLRLAQRHVEVEHVLVSTEGLWWAARCGCGHCPDLPTAVPRPDRVGAICEPVLRGVAPLASRAELGRALRHRDDELARRVDEIHPGEHPMSVSEVAAVLGEILHGTAPVREVAAAHLAAVGAALADPVVRDDVFEWVTPDAPLAISPTAGKKQPDATALRARLIEWLHCLPDRLRPPVLTFIAGSAWSSGSGAIAAVAVEEALRIDPGYRLARLLGRAVEVGARPRRCA